MATSQEPYTLYHNYWSSCSLMVRLALELGKQPPNNPEVPLVLKEINIQQGGQLAESFIADVNRMGTVPVLTHPTLLDAPITESLDITRLMSQRFYPTLWPENHQVEIEKLMQEFYSLSFMALSFQKFPERGALLVNNLKNKLNDTTLSARHREALEYKLSKQGPKFKEVFTPEAMAKENDKATAFFLLLAETKKKYGTSSSPWLLGTEYGTALDAHVMILLARLKDVGNETVLNSTMLDYAKTIMEGEMWKTFMQGRTTMYVPSKPAA